MAQSDVHKLPSGWVQTKLEDVCDVNPRMAQPDEFTDETPVSFVPMAAVDEIGGSIVTPETRPIGEVWRGYKRFAENDVIFAKITPCMENGKAAIARRLVNGIGLGSTEFHVLRSSESVTPGWIYHFVRQESFRANAAAEMTGTAGQLRVPTKYMKEAAIPLAPLPEQHRIVTEIETQFTRLDAGVAALKRAQANLRRYKASVLKAACEGRLVPTEAELARAEGRDYEPADALLARILTERRARWEAENPGKKYKEPARPDTSDLPELPEGWMWGAVLQFATKVTDGVHKTPTYVESGVPFLSVNNMSEDGSLSFSPCKYITDQEHQELYRRCNPEMGDVLLSKVGTIGLTAAVRTDRAFSLFVNTALIKPVRDVMSPGFTAWALRHGFVSKLYDSFVSGSTQRFIGTTKIGYLPIPLPPLPEQLRIVAEVERRLSVVQELEKQVEAALRRAERLRQAILKHAFEGKLVPQDPHDEPASALLARIKAEKAP